MSSITGLISGGGGAGTPINGTKSLNLPSTTTQFTDSDGSIWLRNGNYITSGFSTYPDAVPFSSVQKPLKTGENPISYSSTNANISYANKGYINNTGTKWIVTSQFANNSISEYTLSTPFDIDTATFTRAKDNFNNMNYARGGITFNSNGSVAYAADGTTITRMTTSGWNVSTLSTGVAVSGGAGYNNITIGLTENGAYLYAPISHNQFAVYTLNTTNGTSITNTDYYVNVLPFPTSIGVTSPSLKYSKFNADGTRFYYIFSSTESAGNCYIVEFALSTAYNLNTSSYVTHGLIGTPSSIGFAMDNSIQSIIYQATTSTSTLSYTFPSSIGMGTTNDPREFLRIK